MDPSLRWGDEKIGGDRKEIGASIKPPGHNRCMKQGWVYIMTNAPHGTLYVGVTANLPQRVWQHRNGEGAGFCKRYGLTRLAYAEAHDDIEAAIRREKAVKAWQRAWKIRLIEEMNPEWRDLFDDINGA